MAASIPPSPTASAEATLLAEAHPEVALFPRRPEDRLRLALRRLDAAIAEQSDATAGLKAAVGDLSSTMARLSQTVTGYRSALDTTAAEVERALASARTLQATADRMAG